MNERDSLIRPLKNRLFEIFNTSSLGQNPYRHTLYQRAKKQPKKADSESWDEESQLFFNDFISLDEEKITHGLSQAEAKKAFDRKFRTSHHSEHLAREMQNLENTLGTEGVAPEITQRKLELVHEFVADFQRLVHTRIPSIAGRFDLFSLPVLHRLKQWGCQARMLQHLVWLRCLYRLNQEVLDNPEALLHVQICLLALEQPLKHAELLRFIERHLIELESCQALIHQTWHYLEQNFRLFEALENEIRLLSLQVQPWYLRKLQRPYLNLDKRLGRRHLENRYLRLKQQLQEVQRQIRHLDKSQQSLAHFLGEKAPLIHHWEGIESTLMTLLALHTSTRQGSEAQQESLEQTFIRLGLPSDQSTAIRLHSLEELVQCLEQPKNQALEDTEEGALYIAPLTERQLQTLNTGDLATLEKWSLYKAQQVSLFQKQVLPLILQACRESRQTAR